MTARTIIEAARNMARKSRDAYEPGVRKAMEAQFCVPPELIETAVAHELQNRMELVMDCYLTGAAEILKLLHGDATPEPWSDDYDHEKRLTELLKQFGVPE